MNVCLNGIRHLIIDDETNVLYIDTTSSKVCCYQDIGFAATQSL